MDLHVYRNSQDRWNGLKDAASRRGAALAVNAVTLDELVERITPDLTTATGGQRLALLTAAGRYAYDAISQLKASRVRSHELRAAGADFLADILDRYDRALRESGLCDPQDRFAIAASRVKEGAAAGWLERFESVVLHTLYDLTEAEFLLMRSLIETLPGGGAVVLFNTTANVKPTQFAEWTWKRFVQDDSLAEKTFPEFCRPIHNGRAVLEKLFVFEPHEPLPREDSLRILEAPSRYREVETMGAGIADLLGSGERADDVAVVVRHIETYGEMIEDVFTRYGIPYRFETGVPLLRNPFIKYWLALLDLAASERSREMLARIMSSAYFRPRLSPGTDVERALADCGYIDRRHLRASALAARKNLPLTAEIERFEILLDQLEQSTGTILEFMSRLPAPAPLTESDRQAWRVLVEELTAVSPVYPGQSLRFEEFRKIASDIAGLRTIDRLAATNLVSVGPSYWCSPYRARASRPSSAPGLPRVRILHPQSLGSRSYGWIFAPGFCDGEFPARSSSNPLLRDAVVEAINARIRPRRLMTARDRNRREPLYLFMILDSASRRVTLSYPAGTLEGDPIYPSIYISEIARHYAESPVEQTSPGPARSAGEWRARIAGEWRRGTLAEDRARALLGDGIVERAKLEAKGVLRARFGKGVLPLDGVWHPSELNSLAACPFVFLARHRLKIRPSETPEFEVSVLEIGILAHIILRDFHAQPVPPSHDEASARMEKIIARRLSAADIDGQGPHTVFDPSLWKIRRRQLVSALKRYAEFAARDALDGFETLPQYLDSPLPPAALGRTLVAGKPDHVAVRRDGDRIAAIRVDDFKYSAASSGTARQLKQSFQIPVYGYLALSAAGADAGVQVEGRYLLLRSPGNCVVSHPIDAAMFEEVRERMESLLETVHDGRLEPNPADRQGCVNCDYRRLCRFYGG